MTRKLHFSIAFLLALAACRDATAPIGTRNGPESVLRVERASSATSPAATDPVHIIRQSPAAPPLETYRVAFWMYKGRQELTLWVNYRPAAGQKVGQPFLRFNAPKQALEAGAAGAPLRQGDSVLVTLTIDTTDFSVHFEPSGVQFSTQFPPELAIWYQNADPDLNGDGVVDRTDEVCRQQLGIWYRGRQWSELATLNDLKQQYVVTQLYHFSQYAVSW